jgi:hypothetical protein
MSSLAFGRLVRLDAQARVRGVSGEDTADNKLIAGLAALIPVEVIAAHALVLGATTATDASGTTTITASAPLSASFWGLLALSMAFYLVGRGFANWTSVDWLRLALPPLAFVLWTALIGTSALSPWVAGLDHAWVTVAAVLLAGVLLALSAAVAPKKPTT